MPGKKTFRFVMGWNEDECGEEVVYASNETEAEVKYAEGDFEIE